MKTKYYHNKIQLFLICLKVKARHVSYMSDTHPPSIFARDGADNIA